MKKIFLSSMLFLSIVLLSGCQKNVETKKEETINPFSPSSMVNTYETSKGKINDSVQKENEKINKALEESELNE